MWSGCRGRRWIFAQVVQTGINAALWAGLDGMGARVATKPFVVRARPMGLRSGIDPAGLNCLADDLEVGAFLEAQARPGSSALTPTGPLKAGMQSLAGEASFAPRGG